MLKTLKDISFLNGSLKYVYEDELKQEAIKWVKDMRKGSGDTELSEDNFKRFFNITEEDLKCQEKEQVK